MNHRRARGGFSLLEVSVSIVILGAMASLLAQAMVLRSAQQRTIEWRQLAAIDADNLMQHATALPWDDLTDENLDSLTLSESWQSRTPPARLQWRLEPAAGEPEGKRITLEIQLPGKGGADGRPLRVTAWKYRQADQRRPEK